MAHIENIAAKAIILNNQYLGMVVQWEDLKYGSNRAHTFLGDPKDLDRIYPNYVDICKGFGVKCDAVIFWNLRPGHSTLARRQGSLCAGRDGALHRARPADDPPAA